MLEYKSPQRSVRQALIELQLKTRLLEEERDYYVTLNATAARAFDEHRSELVSLLEKERTYSAGHEQRLQDTLQRILADNAELSAQLTKRRGENQNELKLRIAEAREEASLTEQRLRRELMLARDELDGLRRKMETSLEEQRSRKEAAEALRAQQEALQDEVSRLTRQSDVLMLQRYKAEEAQPARQRRDVSFEPKPFVPSGPPQGLTHNANALVQSIERANYRSPRRSASARPQRGELSGVCRSIVRELVELRAEYEAITNALKAGGDDAGRAGRRLREVFALTNEKLTQLNQLRRSQRNIDEQRRISEVLESILGENAHCEESYRYLKEVIRCSSN